MVRKFKRPVPKLPEGYRQVGRVLKSQLFCRHSWEYWADRMRCLLCGLVVIKRSVVKVRRCVQCQELVKDCDDIGIRAGLMVALHQSCFWDYTADWDDYKRQVVIDRFTDTALRYRVDDRASLDADLLQQLNLARYALREQKRRAYEAREGVRLRKRGRPRKFVDAVTVEQLALSRAAVRVARHEAYRAREAVRKHNVRDLRRNHHGN